MQSTDWGTFAGILGNYPVTIPYVSGIPRSFKQGDSSTWKDNTLVDVQGNAYDSTGYTLKYTLAGPVAPTTYTAIADGPGWQTTITAAQSTLLVAGKYWWQAQLFGTDGSGNPTRITAAEGQLTVEIDLASVPQVYDGRTIAEQALAAAETAYATFSSSGGVLKSYRIGGREMTFQNLLEVKQQVDYWRARVVNEKSAANGGRDRFLHVRFDRAR